MRCIDLNTDTGESFGRWTLGADEELISFVSSANIACGMHAGDPVVMDRTVEICRKKGVSVGAHPGFPDLQGFGRREMRMTTKEVESYVLYQIGALQAFCGSFGLRLSHVKPHGALYNMAATDMDLALSVARGVARAGNDLILVGLAGSLLLDAADRIGIPRASEGFCDRAYNPDGTLMPRSSPGAVITDISEIASRAVRMVKDGVVLSSDGKEIPLRVDTICVHGDTPGAAKIAKAIKEALSENGIEIVPLPKVLAVRSPRQ
ncbi:MAG TPA: 5-oxoprolinase subunit PxpA [Firmicutes bacterium]|nr:5-oxoprolinase subunit PxpA [Candidatus Fermentithermobacillaceae bacterium]